MVKIYPKKKNALGWNHIFAISTVVASAMPEKFKNLKTAGTKVVTAVAPRHAEEGRAITSSDVLRSRGGRRVLRSFNSEVNNRSNSAIFR